ncbi:MAG TPA: helix-turn-helix transcriptional regulator, partial [Kofleriaceae bacterium]
MERRSDSDLNQVLRGTRSSGPRAGTVVDARMTLALWLRAGRAQRGMSLEDVARITKIQVRILERLEAGKPDGLPADVFVRGFVRSFAKCVGLGEDEALKRYSDCSGATTQAPAAARAMVEAMGELTPAIGQAIARPAPAPTPQSRDLIIPDDFVLPSASQPIVVEAVEAAAAIEAPAEVSIEVATEAVAIEPPPVVEAAAPAAPAKKKRGKRATAAGTAAAGTTAAGTTGPAKPRKRKARMATGTPVEPTPVIETKADPSAEPSSAASSAVSTSSIAASTASSVEAPTVSSGEALTSSSAASVESSAGSSDASSSIEIVVEGEPSNVIDASNASDDLFAPKLTEYDPDDLFAPRPFEPDAPSDAISTATAIDPSDGLATASDAQSATLDADMVETFGDEPIATATWQPKMPPLAATTTSVPWRRPGMVTSTAPVASLVAVIDDADPEGAERLLEERRSSGSSQRRSFLPPILLDREDRSARQGGLTLAVIILLIA